jgi:hypothetical protein
MTLSTYPTMLRSFEFKFNYKELDYSKIPNGCAYCGKSTKIGDRMLLPNREYVMRYWHRRCTTRFIADCMKADNTIYSEEYVEYILDNLPSSFATLIDKANDREQFSFNYKHRQITQ